MKDISISDALRYLVVGFEPFIIDYIWGDRSLVSKIPEKIDTLGFTLIALVFGAIFYSLYKVSIHTWFIRWSHDWHKDSYRKYIIEKYSKNDGEKISHWDAERFWYYLSNLEFENRNKYLDNQSSMGHLVYQTGIMLIISPVFLTFSNSCSCVNLYFVIAGFTILLLGWFYAGFIEIYI